MKIILVFLLTKALNKFDDNDHDLCYLRLEVALKYSERSDIDIDYFYLELKMVEEFLLSENTNPVDILKYMKKSQLFS